MEQYSAAYPQPTQGTTPARVHPQRCTQELVRPALVDTPTLDAGFQGDQFRVVPLGAPGGIHDTYTSLHRRNANRAQHQSSDQLTTMSSTVCPHAVSVLSRLGTRFKDRSDKFGGTMGKIGKNIQLLYELCDPVGRARTRGIEEPGECPGWPSLDLLQKEGAGESKVLKKPGRSERLYAQHFSWRGSTGSYIGTLKFIVHVRSSTGKGVPRRRSQGRTRIDRETWETCAN